MAAVSTEDHVLFSQMGADGAGDRFLTHVSMTGTVDQASLMTACEFFLRLSDDLHFAIEVENRLSGGRTGHKSFQILLGSLNKWALRKSWISHSVDVSSRTSTIHGEISSIHRNQSSRDPARCV